MPVSWISEASLLANDALPITAVQTGRSVSKRVSSQSAMNVVVTARGQRRDRGPAVDHGLAEGARDQRNREAGGRHGRVEGHARDRHQVQRARIGA